LIINKIEVGLRIFLQCIYKDVFKFVGITIISIDYSYSKSKQYMNIPYLLN